VHAVSTREQLPVEQPAAAVCIAVGIADVAVTVQQCLLERGLMSACHVDFR
jgi:hypothetical protein